MAIVKAFYTKSRGGAKAVIDYISHRPGKDGKQANRDLYGIDDLLTNEQAYKLIEEAQKGTNFFHMVINFDPKLEDTKKDLFLQDITVQTMLTLQERLPKEVRRTFSFIATDHTDQKGTDLRHIHVLALVPARLDVPDLQALTKAATEAALFQRQERDLRQENRRGRQARRAGRRQNRRIQSFTREVQARPLQGGMTCPSCGGGQAMRRIGQTLYRCPACSLKLDRLTRQFVHDLDI